MVGMLNALMEAENQSVSIYLVCLKVAAIRVRGEVRGISSIRCPAGYSDTPFSEGLEAIERISELGKLVATTHGEVPWRRLYDESTYLDDGSWSATFANSAAWHQASEALLSQYVERGLRADDYVEEAPRFIGRLGTEATAVDDGGDQRWAQTYLDALVPLLNVAVELMLLRKPLPDVLLQVGTRHPLATPDFLALDLWLMRRALAGVLQQLPADRILIAAELGASAAYAVSRQSDPGYYAAGLMPYATEETRDYLQCIPGLAALMDAP